MKTKRLQLALNIGTIDNKLLGLTETTEGAIVTVDEEKAKLMEAKGWAFPPEEADTRGPTQVAVQPVSAGAAVMDKTPPAKIADKK